MRGVCGVEDNISLATSLSPNKMFPSSRFRLNTIEVLELEQFNTNIGQNRISRCLHIWLVGMSTSPRLLVAFHH